LDLVERAAEDRVADVERGVAAGAVNRERGRGGSADDEDRVVAGTAVHLDRIDAGVVGNGLESRAGDGVVRDRVGVAVGDVVQVPERQLVGARTAVDGDGRVDRVEVQPGRGEVDVVRSVASVDRDRRAGIDAVDVHRIVAVAGVDDH
jgi:hypothetical protein